MNLIDHKRQAHQLAASFPFKPTNSWPDSVIPVNSAGEMAATVRHQVLLVKSDEANVFVFAGSDRDFKVAKNPDVKLGGCAVIEERSDGVLYFKKHVEDDLAKGEIRGNEFWLERPVELSHTTSGWVGSLDVGMMTLHHDVLWPDGGYHKLPCIKIALFKRLEQAVQIDKQTVRWMLMEFRPESYEPPVCDTPPLISYPIPPVVTLNKEADSVGTVEHVGVIAQVKTEFGSPVAHVFSPDNNKSDPVIVFPRGTQPLQTKQWIVFRAPPVYPHKYHIHKYRCIDPLLHTEDFARTIKINLEDVDVPMDILTEDHVIMHPLLGGLYDANGVLRPGERMSFSVVRRKFDPHPGRIHCKWLVNTILDHVMPIALVSLQELPIPDDIPDMPDDYPEDDCVEGWGSDSGRAEEAFDAEYFPLPLKDEDLATPPQEYPGHISMKAEPDTFVTEEPGPIVVYYGRPEGCDAVIMAGHIAFHVKKESLAWRYPDFGELLEKETGDGKIWRLDVAAETVQRILDIYYDHELKDDSFLNHDADIKDFWSKIIDTITLLVNWKMDGLLRFLVKEARSHHCSNSDCWRCANLVAVAATCELPYPTTITQNAFNMWKENCLPVLLQQPAAPRLIAHTHELIASMEKKVE